MQIFQVLPESGPVTLGTQQTSELFKFIVRNEDEKKFLRFVALWHDNEPLGGKAPTFEISAGDGVLTSVDSDSGDVTIANSSGKVGTIRYEREPMDIFLLTITNFGENANPWRIRITNNDSESLRFLGFCSDVDKETLQPWMVLPFDGRISFGFVGDESRNLEIRNWGTAPLTFQEGAGTLIGGRFPYDWESPVILAESPRQIKPHDVGILTLKAEGGRLRKIAVTLGFEAEYRSEHIFKCNDTIKDHTRLRLSASWRPRPAERPDRPDRPERPDNSCRCGCSDNDPDSDGVCRKCGHRHPLPV